MILFGTRAPADINCSSGLFLRHCTECGLELRLGPLHALVVTAFFLGQSGLVGETLFGALAILVCLISMGANVSTKANISLEEIIRSSETGRCRHSPLTAAEMMQSVPNSIIESWSGACQAGWDSLLHALIRGKTHSSYNDYHQSDDDPDGGTGVFGCEPMENFHVDLDMPCSNKRFGLLWATIQTEFLTYRRVRTIDPWISGHFQMSALRAWLRGEAEEFDTPLVSSGMMRPYSKCGWFHPQDVQRYPFIFTTASDVCQEWFANVDDYTRAAFVYALDLDEVWF